LFIFGMKYFDKPAYSKLPHLLSDHICGKNFPNIIDFSSVAQYSDETIKRLLYQSQLIERRDQQLVESWHPYRKSIENLRSRLDHRVQQLSNIKARGRQTSARLRQKNDQLAAIKRSRSWRVTRPFRMMKRFVTSQLITLRRITPYLAQKGK
jgi:hypothetical protein